MVLARSAVILPSASNAISAWVTWSRPCASVRNASERSQVHFTGRPTLLRRPQADDLFRIDEDLRAEAAADIGRDHAQLVLGRHADEGGDHEPRDMRVLRRVPEREAVGAGIVFADRGARLDRVRHQAVVDDVELGDVLGRLERGVGRLRRRRGAIDRSCCSARPRGSAARPAPAPWPDRPPPAAPRSRP